MSIHDKTERNKDQKNRALPAALAERRKEKMRGKEGRGGGFTTESHRGGRGVRGGHASRVSTRHTPALLGDSTGEVYKRCLRSTPRPHAHSTARVRRALAPQQLPVARASRKECVKEKDRYER